MSEAIKVVENLEPDEPIEPLEPIGDIDEKPTVLSRFKQIPLTTLTVGGLYLLLLIIGTATGVGLPFLLTGSLTWAGLWGLFALSNVPTIKGGMGPNFALPIGISAGIFSMVLSLGVFGMTGWGFIFLSALLAIVFGCIGGVIYGILMNAAKGSEMAIATYTGFAVVFIFSIVWITIPIYHDQMTFFLGGGLRTFIALEPFDGNFILSNWGQFQLFPNEIINAETGETVRRIIGIERGGYFDYELMQYVGDVSFRGGVVVNTGKLLVFAVGCVLMWMFFRSKTGIAISAVGSNPMFAKATGINVNRSRIIATMISTVLAALGIIVYAQGFGNLQLYDAPLLMGFGSVAAILVGGASARKGNVSNVVVGVLLFQGLMFTSMPVMQRVMPPGIIDPIRQTIQYGVIIYALSRMSGGGK